MALGSEFQGAFIVPSDMPFLTSALLNNLVVTFDQNQGTSIVYPTTVRGEHFNASAISSSFWPDP